MHLIRERCALGSKNRFKNKEGNKEPLTSSTLKGKQSAQQNNQKKKNLSQAYSNETSES